MKVKYPNQTPTQTNEAELPTLNHVNAIESNFSFLFYVHAFTQLPNRA